MREFIENSKSDLSEFELRLAKILLLNYGEIEATSYHRGVRQKKIARLIELNKDRILELPLRESKDFSQEKIQILTRLSVKSFRGFQTDQSFLFGNRFTFVYGRNGTGKSSFVDAIEYSLMGDIQEAKYKRINIDEYIKNIYTGDGVSPHLYGMSSDGTEVKISSDTEKYNFSVIERNRIDNFSRMSAETNSVQQQRLAALVGLDSWDTFINAFSKEIETYLSYENEQVSEIEAAKKDLQASKNSLAASEHTVDASKAVIKNILKEFKQENLEKLSKSLVTKKLKLSEELGTIGTFPRISTELLELVNSKQKQFLSTQEIYRKNVSRIDQYKSDLSLVDLAKAIISQKVKQSNVCPACLTTIKNKDGSLNVKVDPYENAEIIQTQFIDAKNLEASNKKLQNQLENELRGLSSSIQKLVNQIDASGLQPIDNLKTLSNAIDDFFAKKLAIPDSVWLTASSISELDDIIKKYDSKLEESGLQKINLQTELNQINQTQGSLETAKKSVDASHPVQQKIRGSIAKSEKLVAELNEKAQIAIKINKPMREFSHAYES